MQPYIFCWEASIQTHNNIVIQSNAITLMVFARPFRPAHRGVQQGLLYTLVMKHVCIVAAIQEANISKHFINILQY